MEERHMPTNQESKPNGSSAKFGNGGVRANPAGTGNGGANDSSLLGGIQQRVTSRVDQQRQRAADGLGDIADVFRSASNELKSDNETLASYVDLAGDQMRRLADHIRERGVADMLDDVHAFARRRPALFIGGAFVVGLGLARFLKSSANRGPMRQYGSFSSVDPMTAGTGSPSYSGDLGEVGGY
jgi:hypothetical protein